MGNVSCFLRDLPHFQRLDILCHRILLALARRSENPSVGDIRQHMKNLRSLVGQPVVYVTQQLASCERKSLIETSPVHRFQELAGTCLTWDRTCSNTCASAPVRRTFLYPFSPDDADQAYTTALLGKQKHPAAKPGDSGCTSLTLSRAVQFDGRGTCPGAQVPPTPVPAHEYPSRETWSPARPLLHSRMQSKRLDVYKQSYSIAFAIGNWQLRTHTPTLRSNSNTVDPL